MNVEKKYLLCFGIGVVLFCFIYFFAITFLPVKGEKYTDIILGALIGSGFTGILSFYWGSSKGSQDKDINRAKE